MIWLLARIGGPHLSAVEATAVVVAVMAFNYGLNFVVIGRPVLAAKVASEDAVLGDLVGYTIVAQVADRLGALVGLALGVAVAAGLGATGDLVLGQGFLFGGVANLVLSGLFIFWLSRWLTARRWGAAAALARRVSIAAAIVTNPVWITAGWVALHALVAD